MTTLNTSTDESVSTGHIPAALLPGRPKIQMILKQHPHQLPARTLQMFLQLSMGPLARRQISQPPHDRLEQPPRSVKRTRHRLHHIPWHRCSFSSSRSRHSRTYREGALLHDQTAAKAQIDTPDTSLQTSRTHLI